MTFQEFRDEVKLLHKCANCGFDRAPCALDFHHLDGRDEGEIYSPGNVGTIAGLIKHCQKYEIVVLCSNCHRMLHHNELSEEEVENIKKHKIVITPDHAKTSRLFDSNIISQIFLEAYVASL